MTIRSTSCLRRFTSLGRRSLERLKFVGWVVVTGFFLPACSNGELPGFTERISDISSDYSASRTIQQLQGEISVDVLHCMPDKRVLFGSLGSTQIFVQGSRNGWCHLYYVREMEQSGWDWDNAMACRLPGSMGKVLLSSDSVYGVDVSSWAVHCLVAPSVD